MKLASKSFCEAQDDDLPDRAQTPRTPSFALRRSQNYNINDNNDDDNNNEPAATSTATAAPLLKHTLNYAVCLLFLFKDLGPLEDGR